MTERTNAIMLVHLYGHPCDMQRLSTGYASAPFCRCNIENDVSMAKRPDEYGFVDDGYFASNGKCGEVYVLVSRQLTDVGRFFYENDYTTTD